MPAQNTPLDPEAIRQRMLRDQERLQKSVERQVKQMAKTACESDPAFKRLKRQLSKLNEKIHKNHMRQAKQRDSRKIYLRKAIKARRTRQELIAEDKVLLAERERLQQQLQEMQERKRREIESLLTKQGQEEPDDEPVALATT